MQISPLVFWGFLLFTKVVRKFCRVIVVCLVLFLFSIFFSPIVLSETVSDKVLILGSTVSGGINSPEAQTAKGLGLSVEIVDASGWAAKTTSDFASYRAIVLGDPTCSEDSSPLAPAAANKGVWAQAITGNIVIIGTDPVHHYYSKDGARNLIKNGIGLAAREQGKTGVYITLSCYYYSARSSTSVPVLDGISSGGFTVVGQVVSQGECPSNSHIVTPKHPVVSNITDSSLSNWSCSTHEAFVTWPSTFDVLAVSKDIPSRYIAPDGTSGSPYILARSITDSTRILPPVPFLDLPWDYEGKGLSFNEAANSIGSYFDHQYPLLSSGLSEPFEASSNVIIFRGPPNTNDNYSSHDGYDYGNLAQAHFGDPVLAAASGTATYVNSCGACGNMIVIDHGNGYQTRYMHLQKDGLITSTPGKNIEVSARQQIGLIGATGNVSPSGIQGAHIHFGVFEDKNNDGNFEDNVPDGVTDPFGWQSKEKDPWETYAFFFNGRNRTGNKSYYLWTKKIDNLNVTLTSNGGVFNTERYKVDFPKDAANQNLNLNILSEPIVKLSKEIQSIGSTIAVTATDLLGNIVNNFQKQFNLTVDFKSFDLLKYNPDTLSLYSSTDGTNWTKEPTTIDYSTNTAVAQVDHLTHFALMAERKDTIPPITTAAFSGLQGQSNWFRSDTAVTLTAKDNEGGLGVDYTLYKVENTDNPIDWTTYTGPLTFAQEGHYKIEYYSVDKDENVETVNSIEFGIDKTIPEAKIFVDQDKQDLVVEGLDKNQTIVEKQDNTETNNKDDAFYIITDPIGNTIKLDVRDMDHKTRDRFSIYSIQYNQNSPIIQPDNLYIAAFQKLDVRTQSFSIKGETKIKITYDPKTNQSTIITGTNGKERIKNTINGLVLLYLTTDKGILKYSY